MNEVSTHSNDSENEPTGDSKETDPTRDNENTGPMRNNKETDPTGDSEQTDPTGDSKGTDLTRDNEETDPTRDNEEIRFIRDSKETDTIRDNEETNPIKDSKESNPTRDNKENDPIRDNEETDPTRDYKEYDPTRDNEENENTSLRDNKETEVTRGIDNKLPSTDQQIQQHTHAIEVHASDAESVKNPLCTQEHLQGEESMEAKPVEINKGIQFWREQEESQRSKLNLNQRGTQCHTRPVKEMVTKHPRLPFFTIYDAKRETKLHSRSAPMQKEETTNYGLYEMENHAEKNKSKEAIEELPPCMKDASEVESVESVIHCHTNTDKAPTLKHKSDDRLRGQNFAQAMDSKSVTMRTWKHDQQREAKLSEPTPKQKSANLKVGDPEKPRWNQRKNYKFKQGACQVSKDEPDDNGQADTCSNKKKSEPKLPERSYLEDIDFVVNEFDMILCAKPKLPARAYLEDIDFVCKDFEFLFRRKSKDQLEEEQKESDFSANASETLELTSEVNGSRGLLKSEETPEDEDDDYNYLSQLLIHHTNPCDNFHEPAVNSNQCSTPDMYVNHPLVKQPRTSAESASLRMETNSSENQYQPLISTTMQDPAHSSLYDHVAFRVPKSPRSQLQGTVKSQKEDQDVIYDNIHVTASHTTTKDENHYQPLILDSERDTEEDYCTPFTLLSAENKYCNVCRPSFTGQQPLRSSPFLSTYMSPRSHGNPLSSQSSRAEPVHQLQVTTAIKSQKYQFKDH